jgi:hypothetical protein
VEQGIMADHGTFNITSMSRSNELSLLLKLDCPYGQAELVQPTVVGQQLGVDALA